MQQTKLSDINMSQAKFFFLVSANRRRDLNILNSSSFSSDTAPTPTTRYCKSPPQKIPHPPRRHSQSPTHTYPTLRRFRRSQTSASKHVSGKASRLSRLSSSRVESLFLSICLLVEVDAEDEAGGVETQERGGRGGQHDGRHGIQEQHRVVQERQRVVPHKLTVVVVRQADAVQGAG